MPVNEGHLSALAAQLPRTRLLPPRPMTVTIMLRNPAEAWLDQEEARLGQGGQAPRSRRELLARLAPPASTRAALSAYLANHGLTPLPGQHVLLLRYQGSSEAVARAFGLRLYEAQLDGRRVFFPDQEPSLPAALHDAVRAVYGLDNLAHPHRLTVIPTPANGGTGFLPADIARLYDFPAAPFGEGETIALPEFGSGFAMGDVRGFWRTAGIQRSDPVVVSVAGGMNDQGQGGEADAEATLDVEWAGAMAPGADIVVYEAQVGMSYASFAEALVSALSAILQDEVHHPSVVSVSYGDAETSFPPALVQGWEHLCRLLGMAGVTVFAAAGDQGSYGMHSPSLCPMPHVDVPAALPHVTAVGGTTVVLNQDGSLALERAWSDTNGNGATGGGISQHFAVPDYQAAVPLPPPLVGHPGRGVPDVACNADPDSGYAILFQGSLTPIGGTSAASPVWAAIAARTNAARRALGLPPLGFLNPRLYQLAGQAMRDILVGDNAYMGVPGYSAGPGWDAVSGWGVPDVAALQDFLTKA